MTIRANPFASLAAPLLCIALIAGNAHAQTAVARLANVQGTVLVSQGDAMVAAVGGQGLPAGARVVTTGGAGATVSFDGGCDVRLGENQRFTVRVGPCAVLLAEVETLGPAAGAIGGGTAAGATGTGTAGVLGTTTAGFVAAGAVIGIGLYETFKSRTVSPN